MKITILLTLILFITQSIVGQKAFRFIEDETKQPICGIYPTILRNINYFENCGGTDENGIFEIKITDKETTNSYHLSASHQKYNPIWKQIDLNRQDTITIELSRSPFFFEEKDSMFVKICPYNSFTSGYHPHQLTSLDDFPNSIKEKAIQHIKNRVGTKTADNFFLVRGEIWDLDIINKGLKGRHRYTSKYNLCIGYRNAEKGIAVYSSKMTFDENGILKQDILFPIIKDGSIQENIISFKQAISLAKEKGFYLKGKTETDMQYYSKSNILVWTFTNKTYNKDNTYIIESMIFNAHNGKFIKKDVSEGWWIE